MDDIMSQIEDRKAELLAGKEVLLAPDGPWVRLEGRSLTLSWLAPAQGPSGPQRRSEGQEEASEEERDGD